MTNPRDRLLAAGLFVAALALRVPFRSALPYHWDAAEFTIAVTDYNVALSQPHAPGYFLYVMLGRLVHRFVGDPHASLVWVSVVAGSALVSVMFWLGRAMFDRRTGVIAALLAMTSPLLWFHSEVALSYIVDGLLVCVTVLTCWRATRRGAWGDAVLIGALLALVGGVRQQSVIALGPVVLYTFWKFERDRWAKLTGAAAIAVALGLAWFIPMVTLTGGLDSYLEVVRRHTAFNAPATWAGGGFAALKQNVLLVVVFCAQGLMLAGIAIIAALVLRVYRGTAMLATWVISMFLLATVVGFTKQPGYILNFLPGLLLLAAVALARWPWVTAIVCAVNIVAFPAREIREHDRQLREAAALIRTQPAAIVCHAGEYLNFGLRQFQVVLPEYRQYQLTRDPTMLTPPDKPLMSVRNGRLEFVGRVDWTDTVMLVVPPGASLKIFEPHLDVRAAERLSETVYRIRNTNSVAATRVSGE